MNDESLVDLDADLSEDDIQRMLHHINQLDEIRYDDDVCILAPNVMSTQMCKLL